MNFYERALELREETVTHRRWLHRNAEVGLHMPKGQNYVMEQLRGYGCVAHTCGHDFHAAMLLTAAKMLKENEAMLSGRVRFMFQPAEETFEGAKDMMANGVLEGVDGFRITIHGRGAHGAYPHSAIDPINIGVHIYLALESLIAREADPGKACVLTIGNFSAGSAAEGGCPKDCGGIWRIGRDRDDF